MPQKETNMNQSVSYTQQFKPSSRNITAKAFNTAGKVARFSFSTVSAEKLNSLVGRRDQPLRKSQDATTFAKVPSSLKQGNDYKEFALEYEKQVESYQKESSRIAEQLKSRMERLEEFAEKFKDSGCDTLLLRNRLSHDIKSISNDLKEAYNHILVLMNERGNMKKQFCHLNAKVRDLNKAKENLQGEVAVYCLY